MHRVRIVFQASMKLQNKQDIAVFKGEGEPLLYLSKQTKTNKKQASKQTNKNKGEGEPLLSLLWVP